MEERHWWFAARLQDTFHFGGYEGPSLLEDFLSDPEVIDLINAFLGPGEPRRLFFYCEEEEGQARSGAASGGSRRLRAVSEIDAEALARAAGKVCLYAVRGDTEGEVEQMEREVFCGELRHSVLSSLASLLSDAYSPLLRRQSHWGECSDSAVAGFLENFQRQSSALAEEAGIAQSRRGVLERPPTELQTLQQQQGKAVLTAETVGDCEELVRDWTNCIDSLLLDTTDERRAEKKLKNKKLLFSLFFSQNGKPLDWSNDRAGQMETEAVSVDGCCGAAQGQGDEGSVWCADHCQVSGSQEMENH